MVSFHGRFVIPFVLLFGLLVACTSPGGEDSLATEGGGHFLKRNSTTTLESFGGSNLVANEQSLTSQFHKPYFVLTTGGSAAGVKTDSSVVWAPTGFYSVVCINPGGNIAPGQPLVLPIDIATSQFLNPSKNGRADYSIPAGIQGILDDPDPNGEVDCPNGNWSAHVDTFFWTGGDEILFDGSGVEADRRTKVCQDIDGNAVSDPSKPFTCTTS